MSDAKTADEVRGLEYDWLGCDADGHVALFSTAGGGYAPEAFLRDTDAHAAGLDELLALPASTTAIQAPALPADLPDTWRRVAERGLFAFDSDFNGGPYRLVAVPAAAATLERLPATIAAVAAGISLRHQRFQHVTIITESELRSAAPR